MSERGSRQAPPTDYGDRAFAWGQERDQAIVDGDYTKARQLQDRLDKLNAATGHTRIGRAKKTMGGSIKDSAASDVNMLGTLYQLGQSERSAMNEDYLKDYKFILNRAWQDFATMLEENKAAPGTWKPADIQSQYYILEDAWRKYAAMANVVHGQVQEQATDATYDLADNLQRSGAEDLEWAKEGLGPAGSFMVDTINAGTQVVLEKKQETFRPMAGSYGWEYVPLAQERKRPGRPEPVLRSNLQMGSAPWRLHWEVRQHPICLPYTVRPMVMGGSRKQQPLSRTFPL